MEFRKVRALRGPNIWAHFPVLEVCVDLGPFKDSSSDQIPGFNQRLMDWLPSLIEHRCSVGTRGGFFERLRRGTYLAHTLEHVALELQGLAGTAVGYGRARETNEEGVYKVAIEYVNEELAQACLVAARELCLAAVHGTSFDRDPVIEQLRDVARRVLPGPTPAAVMKAARKRKIPVMSLGGGVLQLGYGSRQRRLLGTQTDRTPALAAAIARDSELTRTLLRAAGVPVPEGRLAADADAAWAAAEELGVPVIVKPRRGLRRKCGRNLFTREAVVASYRAVAEETSSILVERFAAGPQWRLLVVGTDVVAAARYGTSGAIDVTDSLHPEVARHAAEAARAVGLDVAGVELVAADIDRPLEESGGLVVAILANPGLAMHLKPAQGEARPVAEAILGELFPRGNTGRVPVVAVTGVNGKTTTTRLIAHVVGQCGRRVGMTCTEGIYVEGRLVEAGDCSGPLSAAAVLQNPVVDAAVLEVARGGILRSGLGFDRCDVGVVTNIADGDHLGIGGVDTPEDLARVKRTVVETVASQGWAILKADDPLVAAMARHCPGSVIFFARSERNEVLAVHCAGGGRGVFVREGWIVLARGHEEIPLACLGDIPFTHGGGIQFQVENALAAAGALWALDLPFDAIRGGLETFTGDLNSTPGRFNVVGMDGATLIFDYGHNPSSLACVIEALAHFPHQRRMAVYTVAGDRRDTDIVVQGKLLGDGFDRVFLYEDESCTRGRRPGETFALLRQGLDSGTRAKYVEEVVGAVAAAEKAIRAVRPGDLVLVQVEHLDETVELARRCLAEGKTQQGIAECAEQPEWSGVAVQTGVS